MFMDWKIQFEAGKSPKLMYNFGTILILIPTGLHLFKNGN